MFGIEVAWNQVKLNEALHTPKQTGKFMQFNTSWIDVNDMNVNFIT